MAEGFTDLQVQVKDLYQKQESEKEVVDIDGDTTTKNGDKAVEVSDNAGKAGGFSDISDVTSDVISDVSDGEIKLLQKKVDDSKPQQSIALPSFDAVKSPQPQFRREGGAKTKEGVASFINDSLLFICLL